MPALHDALYGSHSPVKQPEAQPVTQRAFKAPSAARNAKLQVSCQASVGHACIAWDQGFRAQQGSHEVLELLLGVDGADVTPQAAVQHLADWPHDGAQN